MSTEPLSGPAPAGHSRQHEGLAGPAVLLALLLQGGIAEAQLQPEPLVRQDLPANGGAHWVWVNDLVFHHMADGKAFLFDGDSGNMVGMLSTGFGFGGVVIPRDGSVIAAPETYFSRGTRGTRTDVVTLYDARTLDPIEEIVIPAKRASSMPMRAAAALTDDARFLLIYNFTPAQSVTVVDLRARKFVGEVDTPGGYGSTIGIMTKVRDGLSGRVGSDGTVSKPITDEDRQKLDKGAGIAEKVLQRAGADPRSTYTSPVGAAHPGGTVRIGKGVNTDLETPITNLYVCDTSIIPEPLGLPPVWTLIAFGKRLARRLGPVV